MVIFISIQNLFQMVICFCDNHQNLVHMVILFFERPNVPQMVISFLMIITKSTSNSEYFPPSKIFRFGGGEGEVPTTKAFSMQRGAQKSKGKNLPILYTWWKLDVMFCPHFRSRGKLSQEQGFVSYYFFLSFLIINFVS